MTPSLTPHEALLAFAAHCDAQAVALDVRAARWAASHEMHDRLVTRAETWRDAAQAARRAAEYHRHLPRVTGAILALRCWGAA